MLIRLNLVLCMMLVLESLIVYNDDQIIIKIIENQLNTKLLLITLFRLMDELYVA